MSCLSCVTLVHKGAEAQDRAVAAANKLWPSIALVRSNPDKSNGSSLATAWAIDEDHLITAGHFCENVMESIKLGNITPGINVIGADSLGDDIEVGVAAIIAFFNDGPNDICLLFQENHGLIPLKVREDLSLVETEDPITISGAPRGMFPIRVDGRVWVINPEILLLALLIAPGNSGSPVIWNGEVIGMVVSTIRPPGGDVHTGAAVRSNKLLEFFNANKLVKKAKTPVQKPK